MVGTDSKSDALSNWATGALPVNSKWWMVNSKPRSWGFGLWTLDFGLGFGFWSLRSQIQDRRSQCWNRRPKTQDPRPKTYLPWNPFLMNFTKSCISRSLNLSLNDGMPSPPLCICSMKSSSGSFKACGALKDGTFKRLPSTVFCPPSPVSPWHATQFFWKFVLAAASSSGVVAGDPPVGAGAVEGAGEFVVRDASLQAKTINAIAAHRIRVIHFIQFSSPLVDLRLILAREYSRRNDEGWRMKDENAFITAHPSLGVLFILHPSSFILHPCVLKLHSRLGVGRIKPASRNRPRISKHFIKIRVRGNNHECRQGPGQ